MLLWNCPEMSLCENLTCHMSGGEGWALREVSLETKALAQVGTELVYLKEDHMWSLCSETEPSSPRTQNPALTFGDLQRTWGPWAPC